jgi:uncharacterized protein
VSNEKIKQVTRQWVEAFVVELNLCPFAKRELVKERVRFAVTDATTEEGLLRDLASELDLLNDDVSVETTVLIHCGVLQDFYDYNLFLDVADSLLIEMQLDGIFQVASFHPEYQFADTNPEDAENYTNRSPYPMLHLLRETSLEQAIEAYPDSGDIPERNIALMNELGADRLKALLVKNSALLNIH